MGTEAIARVITTGFGYGYNQSLNRSSTGCLIAKLATNRSNLTLRTIRREVWNFGGLGQEIENEYRHLHFNVMISSNKHQVCSQNRRTVWNVYFQTVLRFVDQFWRLLVEVIKPKGRSRSEFSISGPPRNIPPRAEMFAKFGSTDLLPDSRSSTQYD